MGQGFKNNPADFDSLWDKKFWSVEDIIWMLFGDRGLAAIDSPYGNDVLGLLHKTDYRVTEIFELLEKDLRSGRFGEFDPDDFGVVLFLIHPLKVIDWFKDQSILTKINSYYDYEVHPRFEELIGDWEESRNQIEIKSAHQIGFKNFAKGDVWALCQLRILLFGQLYAREYQVGRYHRFNPAIEELMREVDHHIDQGLAIGRISGQKATILGEPAYSSHEILGELAFKDYPVPKGLIEARNKGDWSGAEELLKKLHENMRVFVENGGKVDKAERERLVRVGGERCKEISSSKSEAKLSSTRQDKIIENAFIRDGDYWRIIFKGKDLPLIKNMDGIGYIACLLDHPNETINPKNLYQAIKGGSANDISNIVELVNENGSKKEQKKNDEGEYLLDNKAISSIRKEKNDLEKDLVVAKTSGTLEQQEEIHEKIKMLDNELKSSTNYQGKGRKFTNEDERARQTITQGIKRARKNITGHHQDLGEYLKQAIDGLFYKSKPNNLVKWTIKL